jgi:hypothetical protein
MSNGAKPLKVRSIVRRSLERLVRDPRYAAEIGFAG